MINLLNILFPRKCFSCGTPGNYICNNCLKLVETVGFICPVCKRFGVEVHPQCRQSTNLNGLYAARRYRGVVRSAILAFKYKFAFDVAKDLVGLLLKDSDFKIILKKVDFLICVPLHETRNRWRGFNQAEVLVEYLSLKSSKPYNSLLISKISNTKSQSNLLPHQRLRNICGVFALNHEAKQKIKDKRIAIVDDVFTTGATLNEIAKVLKVGGAKEVWGITIAR